MNIVELYQQTPTERHGEIVVSGDRLFFDSEEYAVGADGELRLIRSEKNIDQKLSQVITTLNSK